ncbi:LytTR family DNA-binding domain-containing protein [Limnohabitans sp. Hippo4]|uniref:LytR/AlgR family response regulator transcription factor n=1 Tax=Limnohabitans sp. Hippo4 TaxID=1826167 RepID=UPI000D3A0122|nr:LytTR family DNA-binding domain-containing protein [Limnohabitans sp. Hippo4]PUE35546.1 DNA-binding response regulator [Limnohabitans sp. Hippo4]
MNSQGHTLARAVIADDERLMRDQLRARLAQVWPSLEIVAEAKNGLEAIEAVRVHQPDVIFLDIRMPGLTGVEAAKEIAQLDLGDDALLPEMVFITAYDQYALDAFEQGAVDYVLKPAEPERLRVTAERLQKRLIQRAGEGSDREATASSLADSGGSASVQQLLHVLSAQLKGQPVQYLSWLQASVGQSIQMVAVADVLFCVSDDKYTRVQTLKQEFLIRKPIKELVDELDPKVFWQIHRSTLVNVNAIAGIQRDERGRQEVLIKGRADRLAVSRSASQLFRGM